MSPNAEKCNIPRTYYIISQHGVTTDPEKTHIIRHWPSLKSLQELKHFLGLASYYRKFIRGFARIAAPLHQLTRKEHIWNWTDQCEQAFSTLKLHLISSPVLDYPSFESRFILHTNGSDDRLGAILSSDKRQ